MTWKTDYIGFLREVIKELHGCEAEHVETVSVTEQFEGQTVWDGEVEVFHARGDPTIKKLFAWAYPESPDKPDLKAVTVLAVPPVTTPRKAVQAFIARRYRKDAD
jgi:hypothetical protein